MVVVLLGGRRNSYEIYMKNGEERQAKIDRETETETEK